MLEPKARRFSPRKCGCRATRSRVLFRGLAARSQPQARRQANGTVLHIFAISSLLSGDWMYNAASVLMRHLSRNVHSVTAPASLTQRNLYLAALPDAHCAGTEQTRSGTHGGRENGKRPGR